MNRREFLCGLVGGIATGAAVRTWPFRVYSFTTTPRAYSYQEYQDAIGVLSDHWQDAMRYLRLPGPRFRLTGLEIPSNPGRILLTSGVHGSTR